MILEEVRDLSIRNCKPRASGDDPPQARTVIADIE